MSEFLFEYGLFAAKSLTIIIGVLVALVIFVFLLAAKSKAKSGIEIENINDKLDELKESFEEEILSKDEYKILQKQRKKEDKLEKKKQKKIAKSKAKDEDEKTTDKKRIFVINFDGDMEATEVDGLREIITGILSIAEQDDEVLLILDSSGGIVHNYGLAASQLVRIKTKGIKLTVAVDLVAASGGYMMACVADQIIAAPFAVVGSIGVLAQIPNFNKLLKKFDIDIEHHTAGEHKTTLTMLGNNTDEARQHFKQELEDTHVLFKDFVKQNRETVDLEKIANGDHWYGTTALSLNLVDKLQTSDDFLLENAESADIYEISYFMHESISDKIGNLIYHSSRKLLLNLANLVKVANK